MRSLHLTQPSLFLTTKIASKVSNYPSIIDASRGNPEARDHYHPIRFSIPHLSSLSCLKTRPTTSTLTPTSAIEMSTANQLKRRINHPEPAGFLSNSLKPEAAANEK
jgi:hypothetical protein